MSARTHFFVLIALLLSATPLHAQDSLATARALYASAEYEEALRVLEEVAAAPVADEQRQAVDLYRMLCLMAVGRRDEADRAMEAIVGRNPLFRPGDELPPRTRLAFSEVRRRVLPGVIQQQYAQAKTAFERRDFEGALIGFGRVIEALNDPDLAPHAAQPPLADIRTLAAGFYELSMKSQTPPAPPAPPEPAPASPAPAPAAAATPRVFIAEDAGVSPPVTLMQDVPRYPGVVPPGGLAGVIEVLIGEKGTVEAAHVVVPMKPRASSPGKLTVVPSSYQDAVLTAASRWIYAPASLNGQAVKFRKRVQINVQPPTP